MSIQNQERYHDINGQQYFVRDYGSGSEVVLLAHGMPDDGNLWRNQVPVLTDAGYRVIVPDNLGCGKTAVPTERNRFKLGRIVEDYKAILDTLGVEKVHFVSHDVGAIIGWKFAMAHPECMHSFITMAVGHPLVWAEEAFTLEGARWTWYTFLDQMKRGDELWAAGNGRMVQLLMSYHPDFETLAPKMMEPGVAASHLMIDNVNSMAEFMIGYANGEYTYQNFPKVTTPTFGIIGRDDVTMWRSQLENSGEAVAAEWRFATTDCGHWIPIEAPDELNPLMLDWIDEHRAS